MNQTNLCTTAILPLTVPGSGLACGLGSAKRACDFSLKAMHPPERLEDTRKNGGDDCSGTATPRGSCQAELRNREKTRNPVTLSEPVVK